MRNLIKKAIELSQMCDLDISMVIRDKEMEKFTLYNSGTNQTGFFTHEMATVELQRLAQLQKGIKTYSDEHYKILLKIPKNELDELDSEFKHELDMGSFANRYQLDFLPLDQACLEGRDTHGSLKSQRLEQADQATSAASSAFKPFKRCDNVQNSIKASMVLQQ